MSPACARSMALTLSLFALQSCAENTNLTQPETEGEHTRVTPSFAAASNTWTERAPFLVGSPRFGISAAHFPNSAGQSLVYVFGGTDDEGGTPFGIAVYNAATNSWGEAPGGPFSVSVYQTNGVGAIGTRLYFSGGYNSEDAGVPSFTNRTWAYDVVAGKLIRRADMPKFTAEGVTGVLDGKLYVLPGQCSTDRWPLPGYCETQDIRTLFRYNPATNSWATRRSAPHFHSGGAAGVIDGKFYVAGGVRNFGNQAVSDLDVYDPATNTWKTLAPMPKGGRAIGTVLDGKLFVVSGLDAYVYNPRTDKWSTIADPARGHDAVVRVRIDGNPHLLAVGGNHGPHQDIPNASELYTP